MKPLISVVIPAYNAEDLIREAVGSILNQTLDNFEIIVVDDGSTDNTIKVVQDIKDPRIKILKNEENQGVAFTANKAMRVAQGKYIARLDADDVCYKDRLEVQVNFFQKNPNVGMVGSHANVESSGANQVWKFPLSYQKIRSTLFFRNTFAHSSVMFQKSFLDKHNLTYDPKFIKNSDYELWERMADLFPIRNIDQVLVTYRLNQANRKIYYSEMSQKLLDIIRKRFLKKLSLEPTEKMLRLYRKVFNMELDQGSEDINEIEKWLIKVKKANQSNNAFHKNNFENEILKKWIDINLKYDQGKLKSLSYLTSSSLFQSTPKNYEIYSHLIKSTLANTLLLT